MTVLATQLRHRREIEVQSRIVMGQPALGNLICTERDEVSVMEIILPVDFAFRLTNDKNATMAKGLTIVAFLLSS